MTEVVVVTGAGRGLGLTIAGELVRAGFSVIAVARTETSEIKKLGGTNLAFIRYDFSDLDGIHQLSQDIIAMASERFGAPVYGLVNNAAIGTDGVLGTLHRSDIRELIDVNVQAPILLTKFLSRHMMLKLTKGRIINIGSIIASTGYSGLSVYGASKAAMEGFSRSLAREVGKRGITVNVVAPGFMETEMTSILGDDHLERIRRRSALGEFATTESVAGAVVYLLSPPADTVTGSVITVDGGSTA